MKFILLCVGRTNDAEYSTLIAKYAKRLTHYIPFEIEYIDDVKVGKNVAHDRQKQAEGTAILSRLKPGDNLIILDERGREYKSRDFAAMLEHRIANTQGRIVFVIGGPFGFSPDVYARGDMQISLSQMTMTHEMVRLFFVEQLYRAMTILRGESYHHD